MLKETLDKFSKGLLTAVNLFIFVVFVGIGGLLIYQKTHLQFGIDLIFMWAIYALFIKIDRLEGQE